MTVGRIVASMITALAMMWVSQTWAQDGLVVNDEGRVGIGTATPNGAAGLHLKDDAGRQIYVERSGSSSGSAVLFKMRNNNGTARMELQNAGHSWTIDNAGNNFRITKAGQGGTILFNVNNSGNMTLAGTSTATEHINNSSRDVKEAFRPVDETKVLEKLVALPVLEWKYKQDPGGEVHVGPIAEDFQQAFGLSDGKHISTVDASGVTMAAIKGLNRKLEERNAEIARLIGRLAALEERLSKTR